MAVTEPTTTTIGKVFNTRIKNKRDTAANWEKVATTFQPLDGELIVVDTAAGKTRFKVGRFDSSKGRLLYYNEIPFTDEYLYNDLNESQGKIYDTLNGLDERTIIESTLEPVLDSGNLCTYNIGLWQFPKSGFYKIKLSKLGTTNTILTTFARKTKDDGTTPADFDNENRQLIAMLGNGDGKTEYIFALADYIDDDNQTSFRIQFLNTLGFANYVHVNTLDKTTQKWDRTMSYRTNIASLTLKKGDTNIYYDGKEIQTVEIPTKISDLTNDGSFVSYTEQSLTADQQLQAKTNLGIDILTGNTTEITPTQVKEAILNGRPVSITYTDATWGNLTFTSFGYSLENNVVVANLVATTAAAQYILADLTGMVANNEWQLQTTQIATPTDIETVSDSIKNEVGNSYVKYSENQTLTDDQKAQACSNIGAMESVVAGPNNLGGVKPVLWDANSGVDVQITEEGRLLVNDAEVKGIRHFAYFCNFDSTARKFSDDAFQGATYGAAIVASLKTQGISQSAPEGLTAPLVIFYGSTDRGRYPITGIDSAGKTFKGVINTSLSNPEYTVTITNEIDSEITEGSTNAVQSNAVWDTFQQEYKYVDTTFVSYTNDQTDITDDNSRLIARNNLGIKDPFKVTFTRSYGKVSADKTAKEIFDAFNNNQIIYGVFEGNIYNFNNFNGNPRFTNLSYKYDSYDNGNIYKLSYSTFYKDNPSADFTGTYNEDYCYNIAAPSTEVVSIKLNNGVYEFTDSKNTFNSIYMQCTTHNYGNYTNTDIFIEYEGNLYKLDQDPINSTKPLIFKRVSYDSATSSILFETFTLSKDNTITYELNSFEQSSTQSDWNENDTSSPAYIQNRPGGYYSVVNSVDSGTLTTADLVDISEETGVTTYAVENENFNTALTNLNITAGKTYRISWTDNNQEFSYISEAIDQVSKSGSVTYHDIQILGDTTIDLTAATAKLIWGNAKAIIINGKNAITATNTITNVKVEELNVVKIPKALVESDNIKEFDLSNNYTATNKGSIKYIGTDDLGSTWSYALLGFENEDDNAPKLKVSSRVLDVYDVNTTEYLPGSIESSWVNSKTGNFEHGITIDHSYQDRLLELKSKLPDNVKEDLTVRGIAIPTADNDAVNKKYVDDAKTALETTVNSKVDTTQLSYGLTQVVNDVASNYVKFTAEQTLTDEQKNQARENINAPSPADAVYTATASSTDGVTYTATVPGIDSLTVGASFIMIPDKVSTSKAPTLNVNGLGAKPIRRRLSSLATGLQQGYSASWISNNKPFTVVYDGTAWIIEGMTRTDGADVYGAVAQATADANGNNIVDTYATIAMLQSLLPKVTTITLTTNWTGSASPYYQDIALSCVTETSIVDLQPTPEQLNSWQDEGIAFTTLSGNGTVRVYVAGGKPSSAITVQVRVQEVTVI